MRYFETLKGKTKGPFNFSNRRVNNCFKRFEIIDILTFQINKFPNWITMANKKFEFNKGLKDLNEDDLKSRIQEDELRLKKLEFAHAISPLENPMSIRALRRDVARLKTELKNRALGV
jgi:large subunit ribosomal protein L29